MQLACTRCGTFITGPSAFELGERRWCAACVEVLKREVRLWPYGYVLGVGALLNFVPAAVLLGLNWQRLGETKQARGMWVAAAIGLVVFGALLASGSSKGAGCGVNLALSVLLARPYREPWKKLKALGFGRANVWLPVVLTVVGVIVCSVGLMAASGQFATVVDPSFSG
jgi:hypothetical protein